MPLGLMKDVALTSNDTPAAAPSGSSLPATVLATHKELPELYGESALVSVSARGRRTDRLLTFWRLLDYLLKFIIIGTQAFA